MISNMILEILEYYIMSLNQFNFTLYCKYDSEISYLFFYINIENNYYIK